MDQTGYSFSASVISFPEHHWSISSIFDLQTITIALGKTIRAIQFCFVNRARETKVNSNILFFFVFQSDLNECDVSDLYYEIEDWDSSKKSVGVNSIYLSSSINCLLGNFRAFRHCLQVIWWFWTTILRFIRKLCVNVLGVKSNISRTHFVCFEPNEKINEKMCL